MYLWKQFLTGKHLYDQYLGVSVVFEATVKVLQELS